MSGFTSSNRDDAVDAAMADWLASEAPPRARGEVLDRVLATTSTTRQVRPVRPRFLPLDGAPRRLSIRFGFVALALLLAAGGLALAGSPRRVTAPVVATAFPASLSLVWAPLGSAGPFGHATVNDVTPGGPGLVAVGSVMEGGSEVAAVWTSADGRAWQRDSVPRVTTATPVRVVSAGSNLLALLLPACSGASLCNGNPQTWVSKDGLHWTPGTPDLGDCAAGACSYYQGLTAGGPGFVLVGGRWQLDPYGGTLLGMTVATSGDGLRWRGEVSTGAAPVNASAGAVAAGPGGLVAVGTRDGSPAIWTSADGAAWQQIPALGTPRSGLLQDVAADGRRFVAVGRDTTGAASWTSTDGRAWKESAASPVLAEASMTRVVPAGAGFVALGRASDGNGEAWFSADGLTWTPLATGDVFTGGPVMGAALIGPSLVLFGTDQRGEPVVMVGS